MKTIRLKIQGMTCNGCAKHIETVVQKLPGIMNASVSSPNSTGIFSYDENIINPEEIINAINNIGPYKVIQELKNIEQENHYNLIIIGGGSAAFSAAITAENLQVKTLMINSKLPWGGTCVNVGCVPSKYLIKAAEELYYANNPKFKAIEPKGAKINFKRLIRDNKQLVKSLRQEKYLDIVKDFKFLTLLKGQAQFENENTISVNGKKYSADKIIIATGSTTNIPEIQGLNKITYLTNENVFDLEELPESLTILGAGYVAMELAQAFSRFGTKVRIVEFSERPLRFLTKDITDLIIKQFTSEGIEILPNHRITKIDQTQNELLLHCLLPDGSKKILTEKGQILIATGRKPNTQELGLEKLNVKLTPSGHVIVNNRMQTNNPNIYAVGDVANTPAFVYTAAEEGKIAVLNAFGNSPAEIDYSALPWVIFTDPQIAGVGRDEKQCEAEKIPYQVSKLNLNQLPKAIVSEDTRGFVKLIRNPDTNTLLGARIIARDGGELAQILSIAIKYKITTKELSEILYPYLTLSEAVKLAALGFEKDITKLSCCAS